MRRSTRLRLALAGLCAVAIGASVVGISGATFTSKTANLTSSFGAKRIFPRIRSTTAWTLRDASGGAGETTSDDPLSYADSVVQATGKWASSFGASRYVEFDFSGSTPSGISVSSAQFNFKWAASSSSATSCAYIAVYQASTSTLLGTFGSSGSPLACANSTTPSQTINQSISSVVTSTNTLNDLRVRVYSYDSGAKAISIDQATLSGATAYGNFSSYEKSFRDASTGTVTTTNWGIGTSGDGASYSSVGSFSSSFATTRYLKFTFDPGVATGSVITSATLDFQYKSNTSGDTACWYFETYNGTTLLGSHGSSASPQSCNATTSYSTDHVTLTELTNVADANALTVKVYAKESGLRKVQVDLVQLNLTYYLN